MRMLKLYCWENCFATKTDEIRDVEMDLHKKHNLTKSLSIFLWTTAPLAVLVIVFTISNLLDIPMTITSAFPMMAIVNGFKAKSSLRSIF